MKFGSSLRQPAQEPTLFRDQDSKLVKRRFDQFRQQQNASPNMSRDLIDAESQNYEED